MLLNDTRKLFTQQTHFQISVNDVVFVAELDRSEGLKENLPRFLFLQTLHVEDQVCKTYLFKTKRI